MTDFVIKVGDLVSDLEVRFLGRKGIPLDLTSASSVVMYARLEGEATNAFDGVSCSILSAGVDEDYPQRITGPAQAFSIAGEYEAYFKVLYGSTPKRIPSNGYYWIRAEENWEP